MQSFVVVLALGILGQPIAQNAFTGTWGAEVNGVTFVRLELTEQGGRLTGTMGVGPMRVDSNGNVESADPVNATATLRDLVVRDGVLSFVRPDGDDLDRFEMRLSGGDARLTLILAPEFAQELKDDGIAPPRPLTLKKSAR